MASGKFVQPARMGERKDYLRNSVRENVYGATIVHKRARIQAKQCVLTRRQTICGHVQGVRIKTNLGVEKWRIVSHVKSGTSVYPQVLMLLESKSGIRLLACCERASILLVLLPLFLIFLSIFIYYIIYSLTSPANVALLYALRTQTLISSNGPNSNPNTSTGTMVQH